MIIPSEPLTPPPEPGFTPREGRGEGDRRSKQRGGRNKNRKGARKGRGPTRNGAFAEEDLPEADRQAVDMLNDNLEKAEIEKIAKEAKKKGDEAKIKA